jgi:hypothetical protein
MSLFTQPVKDYIGKKDRRSGGEAEKGDSKQMDSNGGGGATNAGAFVLRKQIKECSE